MIADPKDLDAPESVNQEQEDEEAQAQTVAEAARRERRLGESEKVSLGDDADDAQDVVDHMQQMARSGRIDTDAYRGERSDDDERGRLGPGGDEDEGPHGAP